MKKVTLRVDPDDYEYLRKMAESKFDYGGLNLIIRQVLHAFVINTKALEQKHHQQQQQAPVAAEGN
jgi:hypothetical protein